MESVEVRPDVVIAYEDDYFGPPWIDPEVVMLVHGNGESSRAWTQWIPVMAAKFRVIRPDLPGLGKSPTPTNYDWSPRQYAADLKVLLDKLDIQRLHLVGAKYGGTVAMQLASDFPDRFISLSIFSSPATGLAPTDGERVRTIGLHQWAQESQRRRLGSSVSEAQIRWWTDELMGRSDPNAVLGILQVAGKLDLTEGFSRIVAPTLIVTTENGSLQSVEKARSYQMLIPNSRFEVMTGDHYHPAAVEPERCANMALQFIEDQSTA